MAEIERKIQGGTIVGLIAEVVAPKAIEIKAETAEVVETPVAKPETKKTTSKKSK